MSPKAAKKRPASLDAEDQTKSVKRTRVTGCYESYKGKKIPEPSIKRKSVSGFKAIAWNVAGLRAFLEKRAPLLQKLVREETPAVLGFLEHKLQEGPQVTEAVRRLNELLPDYVAQEKAFHCSQKKKGYSGTVVLMRKDLGKVAVDVKRPKIEEGPDEGRTVCLELPEVYVVICYVMNSGDGLCRIKERLGVWDPKLRSYLKALARKKPVLVLGDMNVAHRDEDIWNLEAPHVPKSASTTPEERASFGELLAAGFVDGFAHLHGEAKGAFTYWSVRAGNRKPNRGLRLDYALVSADMTSGSKGAKLTHAFHLPQYAPSGDHCPIGACLSFSR